MHVDWQTIAAFGIVAVAAFVVIRRMVDQIAAFRSSHKSAGCGGCDGCGGAKSTDAPALLQLQSRPPTRIKGPGHE